MVGKSVLVTGHGKVFSVPSVELNSSRSVIYDGRTRQIMSGRQGQLITLAWICSGNCSLISITCVLLWLEH